MATQKETSLRGTKQSHDISENKKQIASSLAMSHARVPKLRFKEFEGEWEKKKIGDIAVKVGSGSTPRGGVEVYQNFGIPFIRSQNVVNDRLVLDETCISEEINSKMKGSIVKPKDILLNITGGSIGRSCIVPDDFIIGNVNQHVCIIRLNQNNSPKFIQSFIASYKGQKLITQGQTGSGREGLNFQSIRLFNARIPNLPEQQKIANFLTAVDTKLQQFTTKKETLAQYKKGVMQQLFNQQLRFKDDDGSDFADWEEKRLGEVCDVIDSLHETPKEYVDKGYAMIRVTDVNDKTLDINNCFKVTESVFNNFTKRYKPLKGDIIIARVGTCGASIKLNTDEDVCLGQNTVLLRSKINNSFLHSLIRSKIIQNQVNRNVVGSTQKTLSLKDLKRFDVSIPSLKEQQKIATYLSAIDKKIEAVHAQLTQTQAFKKGLLQAMFV